MANLSLRIPEKLAAAVARLSRRWGADSDSAVYRRVIEEWVRMQEHPGIRFANGPAGRRAALVDGPDVWEVVLMARDLDWDRNRVAEPYPWLTPRRLQAARGYYDAYRDEIDARIEANEQAMQELERELDLLVREEDSDAWGSDIEDRNGEDPNGERRNAEGPDVDAGGEAADPEGR